MWRDEEHQPIVEPIAAPLPRMNSQEGIERLRALLNAPDLEEQLDQVRTTIRSFFPQLSIQIEPRRYRHLLIHLMGLLYDEPYIPFFRIDIDHTRLTPSEHQCIYHFLDQIGEAINGNNPFLIFWIVFRREHRTRWGPEQRCLCGVPMRRRENSPDIFSAVFYHDTSHRTDKS